MDPGAAPGTSTKIIYGGELVSTCVIKKQILPGMIPPTIGSKTINANDNNASETNLLAAAA